MSYLLWKRLLRGVSHCSWMRSYTTTSTLDGRILNDSISLLIEIALGLSTLGPLNVGPIKKILESGSHPRSLNHAYIVFDWVEASPRHLNQGQCNSICANRLWHSLNLSETFLEQYCFATILYFSIKWLKSNLNWFSWYQQWDQSWILYKNDDLNERILIHLLCWRCSRGSIHKESLWEMSLSHRFLIDFSNVHISVPLLCV